MRSVPTDLGWTLRPIDLFPMPSHVHSLILASSARADTNRRFQSHSRHRLTSTVPQAPSKDSYLPLGSFEALVKQ
jgi:hypothetical protein